MRAVILAILSVFCISISVSAQEAIEIGELLKNDNDISIRDMSRINKKVVIADTLDGWDIGWTSGLNGAQAAYNNWSQGGVNTISVTASTVFNARYRNNRFAYALGTNFKYGKARIQKEGTRKTDDRLAINNKFSYLFEDERWSAFGNLNFSTQFDRGFNYNVPDDEDPILVSDFFAPAYFTQIAGISFAPTDYFTSEAGLAMKETVVNDTTLSTRYGLEPGSRYRFEPGYALALNFQKIVVSNVRLISTVETFTNLQNNVRSTDVYFSNELIGNINDFMNMLFQFVIIYDDDFSRQIQLKQVLSVGFSFSIL